MPNFSFLNNVPRCSNSTFAITMIWVSSIETLINSCLLIDTISLEYSLKFFKIRNLFLTIATKKAIKLANFRFWKFYIRKSTGLSFSLKSSLKNFTVLEKYILEEIYTYAFSLGFLLIHTCLKKLFSSNCFWISAISKLTFRRNYRLHFFYQASIKSYLLVKISMGTSSKLIFFAELS